MTRSYDQLPYDGFPVPQSHPDTLAAVARLFGLSPADVPTCRVLELGCGTGANLLPMAAAFPRARFVGVDLSTVQIEQGQAEARAMGVSNLELVAADLARWEPQGPFDFVLAHGVFSWVSRPVQEALLALVQKSLAPHGVAFVSYSALPGDHPRQALREMLSWGARGVEDPRQKVARARELAAVLGRNLPDRAPSAAALRKFVAEVGGMSDSYVLHDLLAETHEAFTLTRFVSRAQGHGLAYLGDAQLHAMFAGDLEEEVVQVLRACATDQASFEEGMDSLHAATVPDLAPVPGRGPREPRPVLGAARGDVPDDAGADPRRGGRALPLPGPRRAGLRLARPAGGRDTHRARARAAGAGGVRRAVRRGAEDDRREEGRGRGEGDPGDEPARGAGGRAGDPGDVPARHPCERGWGGCADGPGERAAAGGDADVGDQPVAPAHRARPGAAAADAAGGRNA
ncbi:MAG: class I SAM-dependent methyltransferase [Myxococcales bacterium]